MLVVDEAIQQIIRHVSPTPATHRSLPDSLNCVLASELLNPDDSPPFDKSMMDGYAVRLEDIHTADATLQVAGEVTAGRRFDGSLNPGCAIRIMTGAPIPHGAEAVIPVEFTRSSTDNTVQVCCPEPVSRGWNIIQQGSNMRRGQAVLRRGQLLRPQELALLAEMGIATVPVSRPPSVAVLATGDELVTIDQTPGPGQIRNSNAAMLTAQATVCGTQAVNLGIARDRQDELAAKIQAGLKHDILCLSGGVSAGKLDLVPAALSAAGVEQVFHQVAMKPGKPIWFGVRREQERTTAVFGLPGNPVSSMIGFELFVRTAIRRFMNVEPSTVPLCAATLTCDFQHSADREVWWPSQVWIEHGKVAVTPGRWQGSSDLRSTTLANCSLRIPSGETHWSDGTPVEILLWSGSEIRPKL